MSGALVLALRLALAACLYAFLGWALYSLWRDLQTQGVRLAGRKAPPLELTILSESREIARRAFQQNEILIGRDPACDVSLSDDAVSARHVHLSHHHGQWWANDLGSTNGTRLNQSPLVTPTVLTSGDQIECGRTAIIVSIGAAPDPSPTIRL